MCQLTAEGIKVEEASVGQTEGQLLRITAVICQLLQQLQTVETMYEKACMEEKMLAEGAKNDHSTQLYTQRLASTRKQCEIRSADLREQLRLIFELKGKIELESIALTQLMGK